jgi:serine/threonine protein kinase
MTSSTHRTPLISPPGSPVATTGSGLSISSRLSFATQKIPERKSAPYWEPVMAGLGAYAEVFRVRESVIHDSNVLSRTPLARTLVAKVFRDTAPNDYESVYESEVDTLLSLGHHERIVGLRGAADNMPPNFVCGHIDCGQAFQVERCPQCGEPLRNGDSSDVLLVCNGGHRYQKYNSDHLRVLTHQRPCRHQDDCKPINFLFRPYILLEELDHDLRAVNDLLTGSGSAIPFETKPDTDERRRELLLFRLDTLIGVAEGLAFLHSKGCLHADVAPENAMVRLGAGIDGQAIIAGQAASKLIDFGLAKRVQDNRTTSTVVGRITFLAPEQMVAQGSLGPKVAIRFRNGNPQEGEFCQLTTVNGDDLPFERRDYLKDVEDGQYEIVDDSEIPSDVLAQLSDVSPQDVKNQRGKALHARVLKSPMTGSDTTQTTLRFSYALDFPTDIFSVGCLIGWSITGGQEGIVHLMRDQASVATRRRETVFPGYCVGFLKDDYTKVSNAIDLPRTAEDDVLREALLDVICRALVRSEGAYCRRRSSGYNQPAVTLAADLRRIRNMLFLIVHTHDDLAKCMRQQAMGEANNISKLSAELESLSGELDRKGETLTQLSRNISIWRLAAIVGMVSTLCLAIFFKTFSASSASSEEAASSDFPREDTQPSVPPLSPGRPEGPLTEPQSLAAISPGGERAPGSVRLDERSEIQVLDPLPSASLVPSAKQPAPKTRHRTKTDKASVSAAPQDPVETPHHTVRDVVKQGDRIVQESCAVAGSSIKREGDIFVRFTFDVGGKTVKSVEFVKVSKGLSLDEENCVKKLKGLDFSRVETIPAEYSAIYRLSSSGQGGV